MTNAADFTNSDKRFVSPQFFFPSELPHIDYLTIPFLIKCDCFLMYVIKWVLIVCVCAYAFVTAQVISCPISLLDRSNVLLTTKPYLELNNP